MKQKTIMIVGGCGFVGTHLVRAAGSKGFTAIAADRLPDGSTQGATLRNLDITEEQAVRGMIEEVRPDAVINVAAVADIDKAEANQALAHDINVNGAINVARACSQIGSICIFISTDAVFSGANPPYSEESPTSPVNFYGATKAQAEVKVRDACPTAVIARLSLVLGLSIQGGNSFVSGLKTKLSQGLLVEQPRQEVRTPIDVYTLCACLLEFAGGGHQGVFHLGGTQSIDRLQLARRCAQSLGFDPDLVVQARTPAPGRAPRHTGGILNVTKARSTLTTPLLDIDQTIRQALKDPNTAWS